MNNFYNALYLKRLFLNLLCTKAINSPLRFFVKLFSPLLPKELLNRIPIVGIVTIKIFNLQKKINLYNNGHDHILSRIYWSGLNSYESETIKLYLELVKYSDIILDIGANTGIYSIIAASINPNKKIYAFEPMQKIIKILNLNISLNKLTNIVVIPHALAENTGISKIYIPETAGDIPTSASLSRDFRPFVKEENIQTTTLDLFVEKHGLHSIDLMKIDTEGTEHKILEGSKAVLRQYQPIIICEVLKGLTEKHIMPILDTYDYLYFWITQDGLIQKEKIIGDPTYQFPNYLFLPKKKTDILKKINIRIQYLNEWNPL